VVRYLWAHAAGGLRQMPTDGLAKMLRSDDDRGFPARTNSPGGEVMAATTMLVEKPNADA
jgi:hypothetical protein